MPANVIASGIASMERDRNVGGFGFFLGELIGKDGEAVEFSKGQNIHATAESSFFSSFLGR
jgi:hypothetical protein